MDQSEKPVHKGRLQKVFRVDQIGIAAGIPAELEGATFLFEPGKDRGVANDYLYGLFTGKFDEFRAADRPPWMNPGSGRRLRPGSMNRAAQCLSAGLEVIERRGISLTTFGQVDLVDLGLELEARDLEAGTIAAIQRQVLNIAQWTAWTGKRGPVNVHYRTVVVNIGAFGEKRSKETIKVGAIQTQRPQPIKYLGRRIAALICEAIGDPVYRIAFELCVYCGLRGGEPGAIKDHEMPNASAAAANIGSTTFRVRGKGNKKRSPPIGLSLVERIDAYRAVERRRRIATALATGAEAPTELLLQKNGTPINYYGLRRRFKAACAELAIDATLHSARHLFAAIFFAEGALQAIRAAKSGGITMSIHELNAIMETRQFTLMQILGHSSLGTTAGYLRDAQHALIEMLSHEYGAGGGKS